MRCFQVRRGATFFEVVLSVGIVAILTSVILVSLVGRRGGSELDATARQIAALLREAQTRSTVQASGTVWGVHFDNATSGRPFYASFYSSSYSTSTRTGYYPLPFSVTYVTSTLPASSTRDVSFSQITGSASMSTTISIALINNRSASATITISSSGLVSY